MDITLLEKFFSGKATRQEREEVLAFFKKEQLDYTSEKALQAWWQQYLIDHQDENVESRVLTNIHQRIDRLDSGKKRLNPFFKIAAVIVLVFSISFVVYEYANNTVETPQIASLEMISKETPPGAKRQFMLPDGSLVFLNAGSRITYPPMFSADIRSVSLIGEAYFEVVRDTLKPFIVNCQQVETRVLGTSFNLSGYDNQQVQVALTSGKVQVEVDQNKSLILQPGEQLVYDQNQQTVQVEAFDTFLVTGWKDGVLIFDESSLSEIIDRLKLWYGVDIQLQGISNPANYQWDYSGQFHDESLENVLRGISYIKNFEFEIDDKSVTLKF